MSKGAEGGVRGPPAQQIEISGSEKCILVDPGDGFAIDNGETWGKKSINQSKEAGLASPNIVEYSKIYVVSVSASTVYFSLVS